MTRIATRLWHTLFVLLGLTVVTFGLLNLAGDPAAVLASPDATPEEIDEFRREQGFDRPLVEQYLSWLWRAVQGDLGYSYRHGGPALQVVLESLPATVVLVLSSLLVALLIAVPIGILAALRRGSRLDRFVISLSVFTQSLPTFLLGIVMILVFAVTLRWLPSSGGGDVRYLVMPAIALAAHQIGTYARILRSSMVDVLDSEFVRTARAKGLSEWAVVVVHALKNASLPFITVVGLQVGELFGGTVIVETVFSYPGVNRQAVQSIMGQDMPVVLAYILVVGVLVSLTNLLVEALYGVLDARTKERA
ncbi:ABC transporter permease [Jiangella mangrovi]|uniref:ABC-type dipeptide/oligopeptide/nickel transport system permease component n=1 Tax=Jiangella mangrovi TaxID=1524084 RepID=A0A7W9GRA0_9ACTN|nr:ABC transporter permease [Jiangella mangrovi]MBB5788582.1 ABC-type dipeptide/oligopeptide/nickel transport system permease component [Jiangella mangrovi]